MILSPVLVVIAFAIWVVDGAPIFFTQKRVGRHGHQFSILKFRTMKNRISKTATFDAGDDSRITAIGKILRKTKLDEFPQLINVVFGQMSLVGPRPEIEKWVTEFPDQWREIHQARPGITDPASIKFIDEEALLKTFDDPVEGYRTVVLPQKLKIYQNYTSNVNLKTDLKILTSTILKVIRV